jgi:hypothetical protein
VLTISSPPTGAGNRCEGSGSALVSSSWASTELHDEDVRVVISGFRPPGRSFCPPDGSTMENVHVGVQLRRDPWGLVPADRADPSWELDVEVVRRDGAYDLRGPAVQGRRGERFLYLTWGDVAADGSFEMFRRAKLMLDRIDPLVLGAAVAGSGLAAHVELTDERGGPRCARVDPPAIEWSAIVEDI